MKTTSLTPVVSVFIFFIFLLFVWFTVGAVGFFNAVASYYWPTTSGTVVSARVISPTGKANKYIAEIIFAYAVAGKQYQSDNYMATSMRGTSSWAHEVVAEHPVESRVTVHYDPKNPEHAVVEPGLQSDNYIMTFAPLVMILVLMKALMKQIRDRKAPVEQIATAAN